MQNFDLIFNECNRINESLEHSLYNCNVYFVQANLSELLYGLDDNGFVFGYYPEKYEYGKVMVLKDVQIRIQFDQMRQYSLKEIISFIQNSYEKIDMRNRSYTLFDYTNLIKEFEKLKVAGEYNDWESHFVLFKKKQSFNWG